MSRANLSSATSLSEAQAACRRRATPHETMGSRLTSEPSRTPTQRRPHPRITVNYDKRPVLWRSPMHGEPDDRCNRRVGCLTCPQADQAFGAPSSSLWRTTRRRRPAGGLSPLKQPVEFVSVRVSPFAHPVLEAGEQHSGIGSGDAGATAPTTILASTGMNGTALESVP